MRKKILNKKRIRSIKGSFAFIPHRFLNDGYVKRLKAEELLLYLFLVLVCDAFGLSFYSDRSICRLLRYPLPNLRNARDTLLDLDLIAYEPPLYQVLALPGNETDPEPSSSQGVSSFAALNQLIGDQR